MGFFHNILAIALCVVPITVSAQRGYQKDSLQFKVYTKMVITKDMSVDTIKVRKVFCDYCNVKQKKLLGLQAIEMSYNLREVPRFKKSGEHLIAVYIRLSKIDFENLNSIEIDNK